MEGKPVFPRFFAGTYVLTQLEAPVSVALH